MKKCFTVLLLFVMILIGKVYAEENNVSVEIDNTEEKVILSGKLSDNRAGYIVGIRIKKEDEEEYCFFSQTRSVKNEEENYSFNFYPNGKSGIFKAYIYLPDQDKTIEKRFAYYTKATIENMIEALNESKSEEEVKKLIIDNNIAFDISDELLAEFPEKDVVSKLIMNCLKEGSYFATVSDVKETVEKILVMYKLNLASYEYIYDIIKERLDDNLDSIYKKHKDISEDAILKRIYEGKNYENPITFDKELAEAIILGSIQSLNGYGDVEEIIKNTLEYTKIDLKKYNNLSKKSQVVKALCGKEYLSFNDLKKDFDELVEKAGNQSVSGNSTGSTGGGSGGIYIMPQENKEEKNEESETVIKNISFADIDKSHWAWNAVEYLYGKNIINGKSESIFDPQGNVTREEFVKMLIITMGYPIKISDLQFEDVESDKWYYPYISSAKNNEIVNGVSETEFGVGDSIKRQDMFVIIYRAILKKDGNIATLQGQPPFDDMEEVSGYAKKAVEVMYKVGVLKGSDNLCHPNKNTTRAEAAKILYEVVLLLEGDK